MADGGVKAGPPNADALPAVRSIFDFSAESLGELKTWLEANPPAIPVTQIVGFTGFTVQTSPPVIATGTTTAAGWADLSDAVGPQILGLPNGSYILIFGATRAKTDTAGGSAEMSVSVNGGTPVDTGAASTDVVGTFTSITGVQTQTLSNNGNNTVIAKYSANGIGTASFNRRYLYAIKYANA